MSFKNNHNKTTGELEGTINKRLIEIDKRLKQLEERKIPVSAPVVVEKIIEKAEDSNLNERLDKIEDCLNYFDTQLSKGRLIKIENELALVKNHSYKIDCVIQTLTHRTNRLLDGVMDLYEQHIKDKYKWRSLFSSNKIDEEFNKVKKDMDVE